MAASVAFVFSSFFPAVLLGVPGEDTALAVLPAHRLASRGQAHAALRLLVLGGLFALAASIVLLAFFSVLLQPFYSLLAPVVPFLLCSVLLLMARQGLRSVFVVILASSLGFLTFNYDLLLPLLSGFFAASTLVASVALSPSKPATQEASASALPSKFSMGLAGSAACFFSSFFSLLPGVSSAVSATAARVFARLDEQEYLFALGATAVAYMIFSFFTFSSLGITRSGSAVLLAGSAAPDFLFCAGSSLAAGGLSVLLCLKLAKPAVAAYAKVNKRLLEATALVFLVTVNAVLAGVFGLLVFATATAVGLLASSLHVAKTTCTAALVAPTAVVLL